jgi:HAD superfamily hydrolase (TIGR01490 family)
MKKTLAIFDFCNTLVNFESADRFVEFVSLYYNPPFSSSINSLRKPIKTLHLLPPALHKRMQTLRLKGLSYERAQKLAKQFVQEVIIPNEHHFMREKIEKHQRNGELIYIISGGYTLYLEEYGKIRDIDVVIGTDLEVYNGRLTGFLRGYDCMGTHKVTKLMNTLDTQDIDFDHSYVYSDSMNDLPLFNLAKHKVYIQKYQSENNFKHLSPDWETIIIK